MENKYFKIAIAWCLLLLTAMAWAQPTIANLKQHITYLASDDLHGRMTGTKDERKAAGYIIAQFKKEGIPNLKGNFGEKSYLQHFHYHLAVDSVKKHIHGNNVVAYIDNHANNTVIIGAHYDHLGWGLAHASLYTGKPAIHHGADDNASGVAAMLEIARWLKQSALKKYNYVFIAFSGEELGLYGSKWFVQHPPFDLGKTDYMLNFDMVGRIDSNSHTLVINGVGTSPAWKNAVEEVHTPLHIKTTESGIGPSDHTSFYLQNIPVLHFFSGQHHDYHKPSDEEYKINYAGLQQVVNYVNDLITELNEKDKLMFTKTHEDSSEYAPKFSVTLGIMPDYTFEGEGLRIDGVTDGKPASVAGLQVGDIILQLGDIKVAEIMGYMKALGQFKKGDKTIIKVKRGSEIIEKPVQF